MLYFQINMNLIIINTQCISSILLIIKNKENNCAELVDWYKFVSNMTYYIERANNRRGIHTLYKLI